MNIVFRQLSFTCFALFEEMLNMKQKVDCILWLAQLKSYTHVQHRSNHMYLNQTGLIYTCTAMRQASKRARKYLATAWATMLKDVQGKCKILQRSPCK
jgi:hypothetical protein